MLGTTARLLAATSLLVAATLLAPTSSSAHDSWINSGGFRGKGQAAGEWCCGEGDCAVIPSEQVSTRAGGYTLFGRETVPYSEAQPSPDGAFWRCKRPDGTRRCFFAPPPTN